MSGSSRGGDTTTTQVNEPWSVQKPYLSTGFAEARNQLNNLGFFPNQTYAGWNPLQLQGMSMGQDYASSLSPYVGDIMDMNRNVASGGLMDATSNPWLADYAAAAARPIQTSLMEEALPMIRNQGIASGQYGGSRQDLSEGIAVGRAADAIGDVTSNIYSQAYGQNLQGMLGAQSMAPAMAQMGMMPSNILSGIGAQQQAMEQQGIDEEMARHYYPQQALQNYMSLVGGQQYGGTSTQTTPYSTNPLLGGLGGGMTGASLASMMYTGAGANPYMWPMMLGGAALGMF